MSTPMVAPETSTAPGDGGGGGSLFLAEVHRLLARRLVRLLVLLGVVLYLIVVVVTAVQTAKPTAESLQRARAIQAEQAAVNEGYRQQCLADPSIPESDKPNACPSPEEIDPSSASDYLEKPAFTLGSDLPNGAQALGGGTAALLFLIGATVIGAEWSSRSIVALLFWEPRRLKVMAVKLLVTALGAALLAAAAQAAWLATANVLARTNGTTEVPAGFWSETLQLQGRLVVLGVIVALLGFGIANLIRNTGAAMGAGFVYFAVVENAVRAFRMPWSQWLFTENIAAFMSETGHKISIYTERMTPEGLMSTERIINVAPGRGLATLLAYTATIVALGVVAFKRRDLT